MSAILKAVLKKEDGMRESTDSYIDDILVDETAVLASNLVSHLDKFGLTAKPLELLGGQHWVFGLTRMGQATWYLQEGMKSPKCMRKWADVNCSLLVANWWATIQLLDG